MCQSGTREGGTETASAYKPGWRQKLFVAALLVLGVLISVAVIRLIDPAVEPHIAAPPREVR